MKAPKAPAPVVAFVLAAAPLAAQCELEKMTAFDGFNDDLFGGSVALGKDLAVVGASHDDAVGIDSGSAYVYRRADSVWVHVAKLAASTGNDYDDFGASVDTDGTTIVVGAPTAGAEGLWVGSGAAYVFVEDESGWVEVAELTPSDPKDGQFFGSAVAIDDDLIAVGSPYGGSLPWSGAVYVYENEGGTWIQTAKILSSGTSIGDNFGSTLDVDGDRVLAGAKGENAQGPASGAAYVFQGYPYGWTEEAILLPADGEPLFSFGSAVALQDDVAVIGAESHHGLGSSAGMAYAFEEVGGVWYEAAMLVAPGVVSGDAYGFSVAIGGDTVIVGATNADDQGPSTGAAHVWLREPGGWAYQSKIVASDGSESDQFGASVAVEADIALVGAWTDDDHGSNSGSTYFWTMPGRGCLTALGDSVSIADGGAQILYLDAGPKYAGLDYLLLGTVSGTSPGHPIDGRVLPLNVDLYTVTMLYAPNTFPLSNNMGVLDSQGEATASFSIPPGLQGDISGRTIHHAYVVIEHLPDLLHVPLTSHPVSLELVP